MSAYVAEHAGTVLLVLALLCVGWGGVVVARRKPTNTGNWSPDQTVLPCADIEGDTALVHNIRNFSYRSTTDYTADYYGATFRFSDIEKVYFIVEPFSRYKGIAHTLLCFEFGGGKCLALSVEIRKQRGDVFNAFTSGVKGLLRTYELMYVLADERDVVRLRSNYRKDTVYLYPLRSTKEQMQNAFKSVLLRANKLYREPEFYHTVTNNCATNLALHAGEATGKVIPWNFTHLFPRESDRYLFDLGLLDINLPFEKIRDAYRINALAEKYGDDPEFSLRVRGK